MTLTMRAYLDKLETAGKLRRVAKTVDRSWEPGALVKWMFQALPEAERFGLRFDHVAGSEMPLVLGALGSSTAAYAIALGVEPEQINAHVRAALRKMIPPVTVSPAPVHAVVRRGADIDLGALPIPTYTPGKDVAPYITTTIVTRNAASGVQNLGVYRTQVVDGRHVIVNLTPGRQGYLNAKSYHDRGEAAPIAWVIGAEPVVYCAAVANLTYGVDEMHFAGGLAGTPIQLVRAATSDLLVPANAEIVIEGTVQPGETALEGPFGEFAGFMGPVEPRPIATITAITSRPDPLFYGLVSQMPPSESTMLQSLTNAGLLLKQLVDDLGETSVDDVFIDLTFGGVLAHAIVAMRPAVPGHAKRIGRIIAATSPIKRITLVDSDVDIRDPLHLEWAMNARFNPERDTVIIDDVFYPLHMDPSIRPAGGIAPQGSKIIIDATQKIDPGTFSLPPRETMMRALEVWNAAGLPPFVIPKRAQLRVDRS
jgi:4-hydroxy-3-polyprenylbenzoate decarboxylase